MIGTDSPKLPYVTGADGTVVTQADLPPSDLKRWTPRRKATLVAAVRGGLIGLYEACQRYRLTKEEFAAWERDLKSGGIQALRTTRIHQHRK